MPEIVSLFLALASRYILRESLVLKDKGSIYSVRLYSSLSKTVKKLRISLFGLNLVNLKIGKFSLIIRLIILFFSLVISSSFSRYNCPGIFIINLLK
jgi:hypothetical protein